MLIAPQSLAKNLKMSKGRQDARMGTEALPKISKALQTLQAVAHENEEIGLRSDDYNEFHDDSGDDHLEDVVGFDESLRVEVTTEDVERTDVLLEHETNNHDEIGGNTNEGAFDNNHQLHDGSNSTKGNRGKVCCKKLVKLLPGQKLLIDFNGDGDPIGENATYFIWYLGALVRSRVICPIQVKEWKNIPKENIEHLWMLVMEKFTFSNAPLLKKPIIRHMRRLYRDHRHKLKVGYFDKAKTKTYNGRLNNKPEDLSRADWKYLVDLWSSSEFQEKSEKAKRSRSAQEMPHYASTRSYKHVKEAFTKRTGKEASRLDVLEETRTKKSKKPVDPVKLATNMGALSKVKNLKQQRVDGLNAMTDDQIIEDAIGNEKKVKKSSNEDIEDAKKEAEEAKKRAKATEERAEETTREVDEKIAVNNKMWEEKIMQLFAEYSKVVQVNTRS